MCMLTKSIYQIATSILIEQRAMQVIYPGVYYILQRIGIAEEYLIISILLKHYKTKCF